MKNLMRILLLILCAAPAMAEVGASVQPIVNSSGVVFGSPVKTLTTDVANFWYDNAADTLHIKNLTVFGTCTGCGGGGGGGGSGTVNASAQNNVPRYSVSGSSTVVSGASNLTNTGTVITASTTWNNTAGGSGTFFQINQKYGTSLFQTYHSDVVFNVNNPGGTTYDLINFQENSSDRLAFGWTNTFDSGSGSGAIIMNNPTAALGSYPFVATYGPHIHPGVNSVYLGVGTVASNGVFEITPQDGQVEPTLALNASGPKLITFRNSVEVASVSASGSFYAPSYYSSATSTFGAITSNGVLNMTSHLINNVTDPSSAQDAATKNYADTNFLTKSSATATYLQNSSATATYLNQTVAASTYLTQSSATATYLQNSSATATYLQQSSATATYLTKSSATATYFNPANILPVASGGTGTATPAITAGTNITSVTGTWPNVTINAATQSGGGSAGVAVATGNASGFTSSFTVVAINLDSTIFSSTLKPGATAFVTVVAIPAATISAGSLGGSVIASSIAVGAISNPNLASGVFSNITGVGSQSQALNMNTHLINNVVDPASPQDASTKNYDDTTFLSKSSATATYLQNSSATATYLNQTVAAATYLTQTNAGTTYLTQSSATATYLQNSSATATYFQKTAIIPIANGGTNTSSTLTGLVRGGASYTASELSGDATTSGSNAVTLANSGVTAGVYGSATIVPTITVDSKGRITSVSSSTITGASGYTTVADEGTPLTQRATLNFAGSAVTCVDNSGSSRTDCTITGGGGSPGTAGGIQYTPDGSTFVSIPGSFVGSSSVTISTNAVYVSTFQVTGGSMTIQNIGAGTFSGVGLNLVSGSSITVADGTNNYTMMVSSVLFTTNSITTTSASTSVVTGFTFQIAANEVWIWDCDLSVVGVTGGTEYGFDAPVGGNVQGVVIGGLTSATTITSARISGISTPDATPIGSNAAAIWVKVTGTVSTGVTAGASSLIWKSVTGGNTSTINGGSFCQAKRAF